MKKTVFILTLLVAAILSQAQSVSFTKSGGWMESAFAEWTTLSNADSYNVYYTGGGFTDKQIDNPLIRSYGNYFRADVLGLAPGAYTIKVVPVIAGKAATAAVTGSITVVAHDRAGFAFSGSRIPGAYKLNGTPKDNAVVIYITENTKNTVTHTVTGVSAPCVGLQAILDAYKKGSDTRPYIIRMVGRVTDLDYMLNGDIAIENKLNASCSLTLEGVGEDAVADGWGIRIKNATNIEVRNIGTMNCNSSEGDNIGLQQDNDHIWVHNCDFFYGDAGGDADQVKGDGALDCKKSTYITFSYNHFWDSGKCNLLGLSEETTTGLYITYHHNWYDHSDSRHPRVRFYSAHVYNNYYDGNAKYGTGSTLGSSVFSEANYFRHCKYPMLTSMQGSDVYDEVAKANDYKILPTFSNEFGGTIKSFNNYMEGHKRFIPYGDPNTTSPDPKKDFDAYVAKTRNETVPSTVVSAFGGNTYNNFDVNTSVMYAYTPQTPEDAKVQVMKYAGRVNGGSLKWTFDNTVDDASSLVNTGLKAELVAYRSQIVFIQGEGAPTNQSPIVSITAPASGSRSPINKAINITASATDADGSVAKVVFYAQLGTAAAALLSTDNAAPFAASWTPTLAGTYIVYGVATDEKGATGTSSMSYSVIIDNPNVNNPPIIAVASDKTAYAAGADAIITALASDDNSVAKVEFFSGTTLLRSVTASPYTCTVSALTAGDYTITAIATDNAGLSTSTFCTFSVQSLTASDLVHNYTESGLESTFFTISGSLSSSKGTVDYAGLTMNTCLKMETATTVTFTTTQEAVLVLVFNTAFVGKVKIDGTSYTAAAGIVTVTLPAGAHAITKGDSGNMYYMSLAYTAAPTTVDQKIVLKSGWNLVSLYVNSPDMAIAKIFPHATAVKSNDAFWGADLPSFLVGITDIEAGRGYLVFNTLDETVTVSGTEISATEPALKQGWNLIGSPFSSSKTVSAFFGTNIQNVKTIKDFNTIYTNGGTTNTLQNIEPGKAYFLLK